MIKSVKIHNFRSHEDAELKFHPGVNVIFGLGQSGKTNIARAINWVVYNRPSGFNMHSHFAYDEETSVELVLDNGAVNLTKTSKLTSYSLINGSSYSYTGKSVPEPITKLLNISDINISNQLDAPFLITDSPGEVGKVINRITKIEQVDSWISKITTRINQSKNVIDILQKDIDVLDKEVSQYDDLHKLENSINIYNKLCSNIDIKEKKYSDLSKLQEKINQIHSRKFVLEKLLLVLNTSVKELVTEIQTIKVKEMEFEELLNWKYRYKSSLTTKTTSDRIIKDISIEGLDELIKEIEEKTFNQLAVKTFVFLKAKAQILFEKFNSFKKEYLDEIKAIGKCPLCNNTISDKFIKELENSL
jgi:exonuclease SbcC